MAEATQTGSPLTTKKTVAFPKRIEKDRPVRIRPELNLEKWSIWQPAKSKNQPTERKLKRVITLSDGRRVTAEVEVGYTNKGALTTEDQKTYYALVKQWEDTGRSGDRPVYFSLKRLAKLLQKNWGSNVIDALTQSLVRLRVTSLIWTNSYSDSGTKEIVEVLEPFQILSDLKIVRTKFDGHVTKQAGYFKFNDHILRNLQANLTKPLLFETVISFRSEVAQILYTYLDLMLNDKNIFERRTKELLEDLGITGKEYAKRSARRRLLEKAVKELEGAPLTTGRIASATIEQTKDEQDYKIVIRKGRLVAVPRINHYQNPEEEVAASVSAKGREEHAATETSSLPEPARDQLTRQAEEIVTHFYNTFQSGRRYIIGSKAQDQAVSLISQYGFEPARYIVDFAYVAAKETKFNIQTFGGIIQYTARALQDFEDRRSRQDLAEKQRTEQAARERAELLRQEQEESERAEIRSYIENLLPEDHQALLARVEQEVASNKWVSKVNEQTRKGFYERTMFKLVRQDRAIAKLRSSETSS